MNALSATAEQKSTAHAAVAKALALGTMTRPARCERCERGAQEAHHADYSQPLAVEWLCTRCHAVEHSDEGTQIGASLFCQRLFQARRAAGLTRGALAQRMGCRVASVHEWERGVLADPRGSSIVALCRALGVSADWLLGLDVAVVTASEAS